MERRSFERTPSYIWSRFYAGNEQHSAIVVNHSESGMCIKTDNCLPCGYQVEIHVPMKEGLLILPARIVRIEKTDHLHYTIGIEIVSPSEEYLEFIASQKSAYKSISTLLNNKMH